MDPPKKRRRKTAGGGAADDCFTCRRAGTTCDRKRPYCSQCIALNKECSGYKTQLTWGVGVASRGKLRGQTLPVAKNVDTVEPESKSQTGSKRKSVSEDTRASRKQQLSNVTPLNIPPSNQSETQHLFNPNQPHHAAEIMQNSPNTLYSLDVKRLQTNFQQSTTHLPASASSAGSFADSDLTPINYHSLPSSVLSPITFDSSSAGQYLDHTNASTSNIPIDPSIALDTSHSYNQLVSTTLPSHNYDLSTAILDDDEIYMPEYISSLADGRFSNALFQLSPRIQTLIRYYDTAICPFLVAFDGPDNPYRLHVIKLAVGSDGLQNALAALATNNMRMRRKQYHPPGSIVKIESDVDEPSVEESCYKQLSIEQLNMQLADPRAAGDDSVLATLLILCLFHVCDSGFSKFKTQLAGVQKLMSMRSPSTKSGFTQWVEMFFMWFDVMTAAVNDRETQIQGDSLDMLDFSANLGALEQFSGCDGRLFKLIARLGRLSLLAQGRSVNSKKVSRPQRYDFSRPRAMKRPVNPADFANLDGNGWGSVIEEEQAYNLDPNDRTEFWTEWNDIRTRLQAWQMDISSFETPGDAFQLAFGHEHLVHISESFRHSALLYTERLAYPLLPSSSDQFQHHVSQALFHITALPVTSCVNKFLLWPLFIAGTECVDVGHRAVIRARCIEIQQESGFFNNLSGLEVLERVWMDADCDVGDEYEIDSRSRSIGGSRQAFRWRKAMDRIDGEYLII